MSEKSFLLSYKNSIKQFHLSRNTQHHLISALIKKVFHLPSDVKSLKHPRGYYIQLWDLFNFSINQPFEIIMEEDTSEDKSRSQTFSQKAFTKRSGRKYPAQQKQLNDAKFYIDDFQFFMQEISTKKSDILVGILFFNNKKVARYLSKKILRELIFQFDQVQFFYGLHPLKRHLNTSLLGQTLVFNLFKGRKMMHEREFPQNLSAIQEISGYLKCLIKNGEIPESGSHNQNSEQPQIFETKQRRNFIQTSQQRSFDAKAENDLRLDEFDHIPQVVEKSKTVDKVQNCGMERAPPILKFDSPIKSQIGNEINQISFENDFYQPEWFKEGDKLNRINKSLISALIMSGDRDFSNFCHSLDLKSSDKQSLNIELIRVFLQNFLHKKFPDFTEEQFSVMELNMENRQSIVFSLLLKLNKFGNINDFVNNMNSKIKALVKKKTSYVDLARELEKRKNMNVIRLKGCDQNDEEDQVRETVKLVGKDTALEAENMKLADLFFKSSSHMTINIKNLILPSQFSEQQQNSIRQLILQKDPFLVQNYVASKWPKKKFIVLNPKIVKKYLKENQKRYQILRDFPFDQRIKLKLKKIQHFSNLLYYLYKQRLINIKQKKAFTYLFLWADLNILGSFEFYLIDRNIEELIETLYTIDFTYYLEGKYGLQISQFQKFSLNQKKQLIIISLLSDFIGGVNSKLILDEFIRAHDKSILQALKNSKNQNELIMNITNIANEQNKMLQKIKEETNFQENKKRKLKDDMKQFVMQIRPAHFKSFKGQELVNECIELDEPRIHGIFETYYHFNEVVEWIESFTIYIENLSEIHMKTILKNIAEKNEISFDNILKCRTDLVKGVYELYMKFRDEADAAETLQRIVSKKQVYATQAQ